MQRHLPITMLIISMISTSCLSLSAQNEREETERALSVCFAFFPRAPEWFFRNSGGDLEKLKSNTSGFHATNRVPNSSEITLYREVVDNEGNRSKQPVTTVDLPDGDAPARLLYYLDENGKPTPMVFGDSAETHPEFGVRVLNLLNEPIGVLLGQLKDGSVERKPVRAKSGEVFRPVEGANELFQFKYFRQGENGELIPSSATNIIYRGPGQRYTVVVGYKPLYRYTEGADEEMADRSVAGISTDKIIFLDQTTPAAAQAR